MLFVCREVAGSEPAAGGTGIAQYSESGVQSCQESQLLYEQEAWHVSGSVQKVETADL